MADSRRFYATKYMAVKPAALWRGTLYFRIPHQDSQYTTARSLLLERPVYSLHVPALCRSHWERLHFSSAWPSPATTLRNAWSAPRAPTRNRGLNSSCARAGCASSSGNPKPKSSSRSPSKRPSPAAKPSTTCCSSARPASVKPRSPPSSPTSSTSASSKPPVRPSSFRAT